MVKYLVCSFFFNEGETPNEFSVIDREAKRIYQYSFYDPCKDVTNYLQRMWKTDQKETFGNRRIGCQLVQVLNREAPDGGLKIILATDSAREVIRKVCTFRAEWFAVRAKILSRRAENESAGYEDWVKDSSIAEDFCNL